MFHAGNIWNTYVMDGLPSRWTIMTSLRNGCFHPSAINSPRGPCLWQQGGRHRVHLKSHFLGLGSFESETSPLCQQGLCEHLIYYPEGPGDKKIIVMTSFSWNNYISTSTLNQKCSIKTNKLSWLMLASVMDKYIFLLHGRKVRKK